MKRIDCPSCKKKVAVGEKTFPFCSERCRTIDLGRWLDEDFRLDAQDTAPSEFELNAD